MSLNAEVIHEPDFGDFAGLYESGCTGCAQAKLARIELAEGRVVHHRPLGPLGVMACCGKLVVEVPGWHRLSPDPRLVTCGR